MTERDVATTVAMVMRGSTIGGGRGYDDFVPVEVTETAPSGDETTYSPTWSASLPRIHSI